ncbi:MAG: hypothetical protein KDD52_03855 [Bdellovibrionales bacterium]|nr:hypothetical protein [Bdellovibrionales bacterium]
MPDLGLIDEQKKLIPFHGSQDICYFEGFVQDKGKKVLRYTCSEKAVQGRYRISLHFVEKTDPFPYLFSIDQKHHIIEGVSEESRLVWGDRQHKYHWLFSQCMELLIQKHVK